ERRGRLDRVAVFVAGMALVLAGGGLLGIAWELGVLRGLREGGVDPADADLVVGTSAGSVAGAILGSGVPLTDALLPRRSHPGRGRERRLHGTRADASGRYMDGGVGSGVSADLAVGHDPVVVIVPIGGDMARAYMERDTAALRASGAGVIEIVADQASGAAMGADLMDASRLVAA